MNLNQCAMKTMTWKQLGGACEQKFSINTFEEISLLSKQHGKEMFQKKDAEHLVAMQKMQIMAQDPN
jgi:hypothetical protein